MNKRITLTLVLIMNLAWVLAQTSGTFGALTWSYADKQLTISGQGEMINASVPEDYPWRKYCDEIEKIVVEPGVTIIGSYAFNWCWKATECSLPEGITDIFKYAFFDCNNLKECKIPSTVRVIDAGAFGRCYAITSVEIPRNVKAIGTGAVLLVSKPGMDQRPQRQSQVLGGRRYALHKWNGHTHTISRRQKGREIHRAE